MKEIGAGVLNVAYLDIGPASGPVAVLLHGFPYDVHAYDKVTDVLVAAECRCIIPYLRGYGGTQFISWDTPRSGEQAALGADRLALLNFLLLGRQGFALWSYTVALLLKLVDPATQCRLDHSKRATGFDMAVALIEQEACGLAFEFSGKGTALFGHQTPLSGEHCRLNGCPGSLDHYKTTLALTDHQGSPSR